MKKLFGGINLTWKKLIIFAILAGVYTAVMTLLPFTKDTSFRDIAVYLEWWILFGIIIICNSKSPLDSALKCFVFFLISQPLVYLIQVPFNDLGFGLFMYYKYWFLWTLACLPMGFIGYYIKKKNIISMIILLPMLLLIAFMGLGYYSSVVSNFPHHLLSLIACILMIIVIVCGLFDKTKYKVILLSLVTLCVAGYIVLKGGINTPVYETYKTLDNYDIKFEGKIYISSYDENTKGRVEVITSTDDVHSIKISGRENEKYTFTIKDESNKEYKFEYYYDKDEKSVILNRK